jgi:hypothetical protein
MIIEIELLPYKSGHVEMELMVSTFMVLMLVVFQRMLKITEEGSENQENSLCTPNTRAVSTCIVRRTTTYSVFTL